MDASTFSPATPVPSALLREMAAAGTVGRVWNPLRASHGGEGDVVQVRPAHPGRDDSFQVFDFPVSRQVPPTRHPQRYRRWPMTLLLHRAGYQRRYRTEVIGDAAMLRALRGWAAGTTREQSWSAVAQVAAEHPHLPGDTRTGVRHMFTRYPGDARTGTLFPDRGVMPPLPDGRFTFAGFTEPYPGAWPSEAVVAAEHGDLSALWPLLGTTPL